MRSFKTFSIGTLLMAIAVFAGYLSGMRGSFRIPREYEGVWKIESVFEEGVELTMASEGGVSGKSGECEFTELVFSDDRLFLVKTDGDTVACKTEQVTNPNGLKLQLTGFGHRGQADGPLHCIARRENSKLKLAWVGANDTDIDQSIHSKQTVYTAGRPLAKH